VEIFPPTLTKMAGHINHVHGVHLLSNHLITLIAWCGKVGVQAPEHKGKEAF
jgi:hypothetical protein